MRSTVSACCLFLALVAGCRQFRVVPPPDPPAEETVVPWPKDWSEHLGQRVTVEGTAVNAKLGPLLMHQGGGIWIDGLDMWPAGYYEGGEKGKRLRVSGTVIKRDDMPVFVEKPGEVPRQGIPMPSEEEAERHKWRYLLQGAKWTELE